MSWNTQLVDEIVDEQERTTVVVTTDTGLTVKIRLDHDRDDWTPRLMLEPQAGVSLEGEEPGIYYVVPAR